MSWKVLPLRIQVFTGFLPLWCGLPTHEGAAEPVQTHYNADQRFRSDWGVRSLADNESMYSLDFTLIRVTRSARFGLSLTIWFGRP